jgi:rhamnosyl/mannosyltransferase
MRRASAIIVTSRRYLDSSEELAPYRAKCHVIPLGIETGYFAKTDAQTVAKIQSLYGKRIVIAVGRLVPYKGFDVLVRSMKNVDGTLLLIGSGPQEDEVRELIEREEVSSKVVMLGKVDDIRPYYRAATIFVLPSRTRAEAFGLVQLEAMASGLPVINTTIDSGVPELSIHGETGLTVPPDDAPALGNAIRLLLADEPLRRRFASAARLRVADEFTANQMAMRVLALYEEVLSNHSE